jgi:hypothetical protein
MGYRYGMNKITFVGVVAVLILIIAWMAFFSPKTVPTPEMSPIVQEPQPFDGKNATFTIDGKSVTLVNGVSAVPAAPGSASEITTRYFGNTALGDLNGDGLEDTAFLVTQDTGGTGLFYYAVVALKTTNGYQTTNALLIGDRIAPQSSYIPPLSGTLQINYAERKPGEPMTAKPSVGATLFAKVTSAGVLEKVTK